MDVAPRPNKALTEFYPSRQGGSQAGPADDRIARATSLIKALDELEKSKTLDGIDVNVLKLDVINKLISNVMDDFGP